MIKIAKTSEPAHASPRPPAASIPKNKTDQDAGYLEVVHTRAHPSAPEATVAHLHPDILQNVFQHLDRQDTATLRAIRQAAPELKNGMAQATPWAEPLLARAEVGRYLANPNTTSMHPALEEIIGRTTKLDLTSLVQWPDDALDDHKIEAKIYTILLAAPQLKELTLHSFDASDTVAYWYEPIMNMTQLESLGFNEVADDTEFNTETLLAVISIAKHKSSIVEFKGLPTHPAGGTAQTMFLRNLLAVLQDRTNLQRLDLSTLDNNHSDAIDFTVPEAVLYTAILNKNPGMKAVNIGLAKMPEAARLEHAQEILDACSRLKNLQLIRIDTQSIDLTALQCTVKTIGPFFALQTLVIVNHSWQHAESLLAANTWIGAAPYLKNIALRDISNFHTGEPLPTRRCDPAPKALAALMKTIGICRRLEKIRILSHDIPEIYATTLFETWLPQKSLKEVHIKGNIPEGSYPALTQAMKRMMHVETLFMSLHDHNTAHAIQLAHGLAALSHLKKLVINPSRRMTRERQLLTVMSCMNLPMLAELHMRQDFHEPSNTDDEVREIIKKMCLSSGIIMQGVDNCTDDTEV